MIDGTFVPLPEGNVEHVAQLWLDLARKMPLPDHPFLNDPEMMYSSIEEIYRPRWMNYFTSKDDANHWFRLATRTLAKATYSVDRRGARVLLKLQVRFDVLHGLDRMGPDCLDNIRSAMLIVNELLLHLQLTAATKELPIDQAAAATSPTRLPSLTPMMQHVIEAIGEASDRLDTHVKIATRAGYLNRAGRPPSSFRTTMSMLTKLDLVTNKDDEYVLTQKGRDAYQQLVPKKVLTSLS